jgi:hypothetical protein
VPQSIIESWRRRFTLSPADRRLSNFVPVVIPARERTHGEVALPYTFYEVAATVRAFEEANKLSELENQFETGLHFMIDHLLWSNAKGPQQHTSSLHGS